MFHHHLRAVHLLHAQILVYFGVRTQPQHQSHDESDAYLSHDLELARQSLLVVAENLDVVVESAEESQPYRRDDH